MAKTKAFGEFGGGKAANALRAHKDDAIAPESGFWIGAQFIERHQSRVGNVPCRPFARFANINHVDRARFDESLDCIRRDDLNHAFTIATAFSLCKTTPSILFEQTTKQV